MRSLRRDRPPCRCRTHNNNTDVPALANAEEAIVLQVTGSGSSDDGSFNTNGTGMSDLCTSTKTSTGLPTNDHLSIFKRDLEPRKPLRNANLLK